MRKLTQSLMLGGSAAVILAAMAEMAFAQDAPVEQVVVTGTSIRGVAPIGSNLLTLDQSAIQTTGAQNVQELMQTVPSMSNANAITQGEIRSDYYSPSIHDLGASASNSTLLLFDGHRVPEGDTQHSETDPNIIPLAALQRVEVLATGASSIYGSDAVAGVINFITRPSYEGLEFSAQAKVADGYKTYTGNVLFGKGWEGGGAYIAYSHIYGKARFQMPSTPGSAAIILLTQRRQGYRAAIQPTSIVSTAHRRRSRSAAITGSAPIIQTRSQVPRQTPPAICRPIASWSRKRSVTMQCSKSVRLSAALPLPQM